PRPSAASSPAMPRSKPPSAASIDKLYAGSGRLDAVNLRRQPAANEFGCAPLPAPRPHHVTAAARSREGLPAEGPAAAPAGGRVYAGTRARMADALQSAPARCQNRYPPRYDPVFRFGAREHGIVVRRLHGVVVHVRGVMTALPQPFGEERRERVIDQ